MYSCSYLVMNLMPSVEEIESKRRKQLLYFLFVLKRLEFIGFVNRTQLMQHCLYVLAAAMMTVDFCKLQLLLFVSESSDAVADTDTLGDVVLQP